MPFCSVLCAFWKKEGKELEKNDTAKMYFMRKPIKDLIYFRLCFWRNSFINICLKNFVLK